MPAIAASGFSSFNKADKLNCESTSPVLKTPYVINTDVILTLESKQNEW